MSSDTPNCFLLSWRECECVYFYKCRMNAFVYEYARRHVTLIPPMLVKNSPKLNMDIHSYRSVREVLLNTIPAYQNVELTRLFMYILAFVVVH